MRNLTTTRQNGITLIELIIALAIVAVGAGLATSGVSAAIHAAHTSNATSSLYAALTLARSRAA
ncbi:MAG: pilus assembly FimT family protein, partial [Rudaea sp.]